MNHDSHQSSSKLELKVNETCMIVDKSWRSNVRKNWNSSYFSSTFIFFKLIFHLAIFFARTSKKRMLLGGDVVSVCRQPIKLIFHLFAPGLDTSGESKFQLFLDRIATEDKFSSTPLQVQEVNEKKSVVNDKLDQEEG